MRVRVCIHALYVRVLSCQREPSLIDLYLEDDLSTNSSSSLVSLLSDLVFNLTFESALLPPLARILDALAARPQASQLVQLTTFCSPLTTPPDF
jgi:predicted nicotinamide N-methyase